MKNWYIFTFERTFIVRTTNTWATKTIILSATSTIWKSIFAVYCLDNLFTHPSLFTMWISAWYYYVLNYIVSKRCLVMSNNGIKFYIIIITINSDTLITRQDPHGSRLISKAVVERRIDIVAWRSLHGWRDLSIRFTWKMCLNSWGHEL